MVEVKLDKPKCYTESPLHLALTGEPYSYFLQHILYNNKK